MIDFCNRRILTACGLAKASNWRDRAAGKGVISMSSRPQGRPAGIGEATGVIWRLTCPMRRSRLLADTVSEALASRQEQATDREVAYGAGLQTDSRSSKPDAPVRRPARNQRFQLQGAAWNHSRTDRPERGGQDNHLQRHQWFLRADLRTGALRGRGRIRPQDERAGRTGIDPHVSGHDPVPGILSARQCPYRVPSQREGRIPQPNSRNRPGCGERRDREGPGNP